MTNTFEQLNTLLNSESSTSNSHFYLWSKDKYGKYLSCNKPMYDDVGFSNESGMNAIFNQ